jgi:NAD(P)-dependent dehydrogenase (short-subunit alcohol dehydrogenase family)
MLAAMNEHLFIVTGASRGLGLAMAEQLLATNHHLLCIARAPNPALTQRGLPLEQWAQDLAEPLPVAARLEAWLGGLHSAGFASATLINNAATLSEPGPLEDSDPADLVQAMRVGLEAPLLLSAAFLRATQRWPGGRRLLHISSGLGRRAMAGSAAYCAVKGGLDHLARAQALEQAALPNGARVVSLAPGVIDTDMQSQLRNADPKRFGEQARFAELKAGGLLDTPSQAAAKVLGYLNRADFGQQPIGDVRDA